MKLSALFVPLLASLVRTCIAKSSTGNSVLVVLEKGLDKADYSLFFDDLRSRGYELTFRAPKDQKPAVWEYDVPQFAHVIMFAPTTKTFAEDLSPQSLYHLLKESPSTNLLIALSPQLTPLSSFASEFALGLPPPNTPLISHFPVRAGPRIIVPVPLPSNPHPLLSKDINPILFEGQAHIVGDNPLLFPILNAPAESFSSEGEEDRTADALVEAADKGGEGLWAGSKMSVVSGFQATNGGRVAFAGGVQLFSNKAFKGTVDGGKKSGNAQFAHDLTAWTFQETLVYLVDSATHHLASDPTKTQKDRYTINDELTFTMQLSQYDPVRSAYIAKSDITDMQLEFTMLDPFIRTGLKAVPGVPGAYSLTFRAPDRHGVFKFVVDYKRKGFTPVHVALQAAIVPPRHDGYPRFLSAAWPYYAGAFSTSIGFIFFVVVYLGGEAEAERKRAAKGKGKVE